MMNKTNKRVTETLHEATKRWEQIKTLREDDLWSSISNWRRIT